MTNEPRFDSPVEVPRSFALALQAQRRVPDWFLVHGTITGSDLGPARRMHARLERDGRVYDPTVRWLFSADVYNRPLLSRVAVMCRYLAVYTA